MPEKQEIAVEEYDLVSAEVMAELRISPRTLYRYIADGKLPSVRLGGDGARRFKRSHIDALKRGERASLTLSAASSPEADATVTLPAPDAPQRSGAGTHAA